MICYDNLCAKFIIVEIQFFIEIAVIFSLSKCPIFRYASIDDTGLEKCISEGPKSIAFTQLVEWVTKELQFLYSLDEHVNAITTPDDSSSFLMELRSFLREIG